MKNSCILVLRIGHRLKRDERLSTHCGLIARALGAKKIIYSGEKDEKLLKSISDLTRKWGGTFQAGYQENWKSVINYYKRKKFLIVHLTMYGEPVKQRITKIRKSKKILVIIGSGKVPPEVYQKIKEAGRLQYIYNTAAALRGRSFINIFARILQRK